MATEANTPSRLFACVDQVSPVLFIVICIGALIAGAILQQHNKLTLKQPYLAMTARLKVERPTSFYVVVGITVIGTFGYFAYAYRAICGLAAI